MNEDWKKFLQQKITNVTQSNNEHCLVDLSSFDIIEISGDDAEDFLQGQLSSDVSSLEIGTWQMSSWCNIKGRVIATFFLYRDTQRYFLLLKNTISEKLSKRLQMFVLRAKVTITNLSEEFVPIGLTADLNKEALSYIDGIENTHLLTIRTGSEPARSIIICPVTNAKELWQKISEQADVSEAAQWEILDIQSGIPWVGEECSEEFLPQSLNLDLLGGLSFDKGCYPGQEIVARMHFRGKLKQRLYCAKIATQDKISIKAKVSSNSAQQHVGQVVNCIEDSEANYLILLTLDLEATEADSLFFESENGPYLELSPLPYSLAN
ncbi:MAG: hypothetical protein GKR93_18900 [Gammaproteobacteria bacterium]|nr:hypothetical protein [Gammaproteobacteria bacterium]